MTDPGRVRGQFIPEALLPPGWADIVSTDHGEPVPAKAAATAVLIRDDDEGAQIFLLQRNRSSGFVPGAYVFPGGRVDAADDDARLTTRAIGLPADPPAAFWMAALRETFEETGVLLARGRALPDAAALQDQRDALLEDRATLHDVLTTLDLRPDFAEIVQIAHWITPLVEPRRYDTRFFLAAAPAGASASHDAREMSDAIWIRPRDALERFRAGRLRMVFPTVHTLEMLAGYDTVAAALDDLRGTPVRAILPRLVRSDGGVRTIIDEENDT